MAPSKLETTKKNNYGLYCVLIVNDIKYSKNCLKFWKKLVNFDTLTKTQ